MTAQTRQRNFTIRLRPGMTRAQAIKELRQCYEAIAECELAYGRAYSSQHGYIGRQSALEDAVSDAGAYADTLTALEAFLASDKTVVE